MPIRKYPDIAEQSELDAALALKQFQFTIATLTSTTYEKNNANLVLTGTGDAATINAAISANMYILFRSGTVYLEKAIVMPANCHLTSTGNTTFYMNNAVNSLLSANTEVASPLVTVTNGALFAVNDHIVVTDETRWLSAVVISKTGNVLTLDINVGFVFATGATTKAYIIHRAVEMGDYSEVSNIKVLGNRTNRWSHVGASLTSSAAWHADEDGTIGGGYGVDMNYGYIHHNIMSNTSSNGVLYGTGSTLNFNFLKLRVEYNRLSDIGNKGILVHCSSAKQSEYLVVANNHIENCGVGGGGAATSNVGFGDCIQLAGTSPRIKYITNNYCSNPLRSGIYVAGNATVNGGYCIISNNIIRNWARGNMSSTDYYSAISVGRNSNMIISGNDMGFDSYAVVTWTSGSRRTNLTYGISVFGSAYTVGATHITICNNIIPKNLKHLQ